MRSFIQPDSLQLFDNSIDATIGQGNKTDLEVTIVTGRQHLKDIHILAKVFDKKYGEGLVLVGGMRDITKQRKIEQDYKNMVEELHSSNRELEEFAYVASHDLQEPLRKISTFTDRLTTKYKGVLDNEGNMYLSRVVRSAENMRVLINDLLDFSRITKTAHPFTQIDLNSVLRMVKLDLELTIEETHTQIKSCQLPVVEGINPQLKQLFNNIISNSIKFRKKGETPAITIDCNEVGNKEKEQYGLLREPSYYKITISDNGIGFEEQYASRIFQVFQRLHGKSEYPGSGVGLAICKKIVEYHHGVIYAESTIGKGASFVVLLPNKQYITQN